MFKTVTSGTVSDETLSMNTRAVTISGKRRRVVNRVTDRISSMIYLQLVYLSTYLLTLVRSEFYIGNYGRFKRRYLRVSFGGKLQNQQLLFFRVQKVGQ